MGSLNTSTLVNRMPGIVCISQVIIIIIIYDRRQPVAKIISRISIETRKKAIRPPEGSLTTQGYL